MVISYYGLECFKVQFGELTIAFNPPAKEAAHKSPKFGADIVFVSLPHQDFNGVGQVAFGEKVPFAIEGPGEYELKGITGQGFPIATKYDGDNRIGAVYKVTLESMMLAFLGPLPNASARSAHAKSALEGADILFVPIGGGEVLDPSAAHKLAVSLEPRLIVPMHYEEKGKELTQFLKECGQSSASVEKLTLKKKDVEKKKGEVVCLSFGAK
jgi:L-ascorbate metabolism protein UlaG (beta-lactamase superfamily)